MDDDDEAGQFSFLNFGCSSVQTSGESYRQVWRDFAVQAAAMTESPGGKIFFAGHEDVFAEYINAVRAHHRDGMVLDLSLGRRKSSDPWVQYSNPKIFVCPTSGQRPQCGWPCAQPSAISCSGGGKLRRCGMWYRAKFVRIRISESAPAQHAQDLGIGARFDEFVRDEAEVPQWRHLRNSAHGVRRQAQPGLGARGDGKPRFVDDGDQGSGPGARTD